MEEDYNTEKEHQVIEEYNSMRTEAEAFARDCEIYDDFYDGDHWRNSNIIFASGWNLDNSLMADVVRIVENQCKKIVGINTEILMNKAPSFRIPKPQEEDPFVDSDPYDEEADERQMDQITDIEKCLRLILNKTKYHVQLSNGASNGCQYGRTVFLGKIFNNPEYGKMAGFKNLSPKAVRLKFRSGSDTEVEKVFWEEMVSPREARGRYKDYMNKEEVEIFSKDDYVKVIAASNMSDTGWADLAYLNWQKEQESINLPIQIIHCYDGEDYSVAYRDRVLFQKAHKIARIAEDGKKLPPVWFIPNAPMGEIKSAGQSDIREILPTQILINRYVSLEYALLDGTILPSKEVISNREAVFEAIKGTKQFDVRLNPGESVNFKAPQINSYPLVQSIKDKKQHIADVTGITNAVVGDPAGSINTGPALKIQYHPAERKILKKSISWIAELRDLYSWLLKTTAENNPKFAELIHFEGKPYTLVDVFFESKTPQDESISVTNDVNLVTAGIVSKESVSRKHDVKNVEYEMKKIEMEKRLEAQIQAEAKGIIEGGQGGPAQGGEAEVDQEAQQSSIAMADEENFQMASGKQVPPTDPNSVADWEAHNQGHMEFIQSEQFAGLPEGVQQLFEYHLQNVEQGGGQAQRGGMGGGGGIPEPERPKQDQAQNKVEESPLGPELPKNVELNNLKQRGSV